MGGSILLIGAAVSAAVSVAVLRLSWGRKRRAAALNALGWGLIALAAALGWAGAGAWGTSVVALIGMAVAALVLAVAAVRSPMGKARASNRRVGMLPEAGEPKRIGRRVVTFLLTVPLALFVSVGLAVVVRALADLAGASEADSIVLALLATPLVWAILVHVLLIQRRRAAQWKVLLAAALPTLPVVAGGLIA